MAFRLDPAAQVEFQVAAREHGVPYVEVRHLEAACRAVGKNEGGLIFAGAIRPWDREVLVEHAARAKVEVHFVGKGAGAADARRVLSSYCLRTRGAR